MLKHTQTICQQFPTNCLSVFDYFVGFALKGLMNRSSQDTIPRISQEKDNCSDCYELINIAYSEEKYPYI